MRTSFHKLRQDVIGYSLLLLFLYCFFVIDPRELSFTIPGDWMNVNSIFLSIVLEAIPFILLGVFVSSFIQIFVSERTIQRFIPKHPIAALLPAALVSAILPVCECAIIPVVRRLLKKGMPLHVGVVLLVGAPILNPIVFASTYYAFGAQKMVVYGRMGLAFVLCITIGFLVYLLFRNRNQLRGEEADSHVHHSHEEGNRFKQMLFHASDEFFDMGKYLIMGAFVASLFQTFLDRNVLMDLGSSEHLSPLVMMAFAYVLSLCSEADAFVAASFTNTFSTGSLLAFLVYGPMLDVKNTLMMLSAFKAKFTAAFIVIVTVCVYAAVWLFQQWFIL
ncbi:MAG TPA: permease [Bacillus sp. (in: firmicutes)]|nr:permease [Bacillus sp. (in: firmicutes)]